ncbi:GntR family transcriptional regulator [Roseomonas populi]|uniref:GntR family transcriptional regulator n=1 Tax=Roseomonas populi TaxID=3121582 RepID=A0ABT1XBC8_9PROT|nr:GntR family transcriptional regulator [Roseomonas pecuniae]MCR0985440.1 GntR family transcriptional regulator [Roseomonas pecuniae]
MTAGVVEGPSMVDLGASPGVPPPIPYYLTEQIRRGIILGRYPPGSPLREQALQAEFRCSRAPIRDALRLLERRGLVTHAPRQGFRVRRVTPEEVRQIYEVRALLERHAVEELKDRVTPALLEELRAQNVTMRSHREAGRVEEYIAANLAFHAALHRHAGNEPLARALDAVQELAEPLRHAMLVRSLHQSRAAEEHDKIIDLLACNQIADAAAAMHRHVFTGMPAALDIVTDREWSGDVR